MSASIKVALRERYKAPAYAILFEVRNGTGYQRSSTRYADAIAMSLWPSRGLEIIGIEIKSARSDWLRERDNPAKAEEIVQYCDRWWVAAGDDGIVLPGELPPTWGLMVLRKSKLVAIAEAPKLEAKPPDKLFLASMLRRAQEATVGRDEIAAEVEKARQVAWEAGAKAERSSMRYEQTHHESLRKHIEAFEAASGVKIEHQWDIGNIAAAVKFVRDGGIAGAHEELVRMRTRMVALLDAFDVQLGGAAAHSELNHY
jgi:hypothetical protein